MKLVERATAPEKAGPTPRWRRWAADLLTGRGVLSLVMLLALGALLMAGSSYAMFQSSSDAARYQCYALAFWHGHAALSDLPGCGFLAHSAGAAWRTLPNEYPVLALIPFSVALLVPAMWYQVAFGLWMAAVAAAICWYLWRVGPRGAALAFAVSLVAGGWGTAAGRFDLVPAAFTLLAVVAGARGRFARASLFLALATMLKLYPLPLLLPLFLAEQRATPGPFFRWQRLRGVGVFVATCGGLLALALLLSPGGALKPALYFADRPIQIESLPASLLWLASLLGAPICTSFQFGSLNLYDRVQGVCTSAPGQSPGLLTHSLSLGALGLLVVGVAAIAWMQWRGRLQLPQASLAILLVVMLTGKVFSPQYLIWLAPLAAYAEGFDLFWFALWLPIALLTNLIYPTLYGIAGDLRTLPAIPIFYPLVALRNLLFAGLTGNVLFGFRRRLFAISAVSGNSAAIARHPPAQKRCPE